MISTFPTFAEAPDPAPKQVRGLRMRMHRHTDPLVAHSVTDVKQTGGWLVTIGIHRLFQISSLPQERSAIPEHDFNEAAPYFASLDPGYRAPARPYGLRAAANLLNQINLIPPVQSHFKKYFCFRIPQIRSRTLAIPPHKRGVS
jgi:hypothetical protein